MNIAVSFLIGLYFIIPSYSRLIERYTNKSTTINITSTGHPPIRLTRDVSEENGLAGFSKEDNGQSDEFIQSYTRKIKQYFKTKASQVRGNEVPRVSRASSEIIKGTTKNRTQTDAPPKTSKVVLVKRPLPKFKDLDYDEEFEKKAHKPPQNNIDSGEHEDEDFNLDDYDFDVAHDEFIGRGKPLEPRIKTKYINDRDDQSIETEFGLHRQPTPEIKIQSKVVIPDIKQITSVKKERDVENVALKAIDKAKYDDYFDDKTTTVKVTVKDNKSPDFDDDFVDENDDSKEQFRRSPVRSARSPWNVSSYVNKLGEKTSSIMSKVLSILPMFPEVPHQKNIEFRRIK